MARRKKQRSMVYAISVGAHLAVAAVLVLIPQEKLREVVAIALNETKEEKKPEPPKPPPHPAERPTRAPGHNARPAAAAHAEAATPTGPAAFTDIGIALDSSSSDGIAVNVAPRPTAAPVSVPTQVKPKVLVAHRTEATCTEEIVKARPITRIPPSWTDSARHAHVQGRVRIELLVNESGEVVQARLIEGLGYGLDEVALGAARRWRFSPATLCNKPVAAPVVIAIRFVLPT
jgi:protein TonB